MVDLFAGIPAKGYAAALAWTQRLLGSPPSFEPTDTEDVWELAEHRSLYIEQRPGHAGMHTIIVDDFDAPLTRIADRGWSPPSRRPIRMACARPSTAIPTGTRSGSATFQADRTRPGRLPACQP
jgi:hypothetical protein